MADVLKRQLANEDAASQEPFERNWKTEFRMLHPLPTVNKTVGASNYVRSTYRIVYFHMTPQKSSFQEHAPSAQHARPCTFLSVLDQALRYTDHVEQHNIGGKDAPQEDVLNKVAVITRVAQGQMLKPAWQNTGVKGAVGISVQQHEHEESRQAYRFSRYTSGATNSAQNTEQIVSQLKIPPRPRPSTIGSS